VFLFSAQTFIFRVAAIPTNRQFVMVMLTVVEFAAR